MSHERLKIGLALGGGAARGIAHIGILQTLEKAEIPISYIAGTSSGALVGALYASGVSLQKLEEFALKLKWTDMFFPRPTLRSLVSSKRLVKLLHKYCRAVRFEDLHIPLSVTASDFETGKSVVMTEGDLFPAVRASCSVPLICPPVRLNGRYYIDGGFAAELPVHAAREMGADIVVACDVHYKTELLGKPKNVIITLKHLMRLTAQRNAEDAKKYADIAINVDISGIGLMDLHKGRELLQRGRQAAEAVLPELKKN